MFLACIFAMPACIVKHVLLAGKLCCKNHDQKQTQGNAVNPD